MYNPNKFNYPSLSKETVEGSRKYVTPDGSKLPSVTTILSSTQSEEKKRVLQEWRNRVGHQKAQEITTEAAGRGTRMHKYLEDYVKTGKMNEPGSNPYSIQSHKMAQSIVYEGLSKCNEFWGTEVSLYFPKIYAGTSDLIGVHDGQDAIMDHKQSNKLKKREYIDDYFVQLCAYAMAHNEVYNTRIRKGVIMMCTQDNIYQEFILEGIEFDKYTDAWLKKLEQYYSKFI